MARFLDQLFGASTLLSFVSDAVAYLNRTFYLVDCCVSISFLSAFGLGLFAESGTRACFSLANLKEYNSLSLCIPPRKKYKHGKKTLWSGKASPEEDLGTES